MSARGLNPEEEWTRGGVPVRMLGPEGGWIGGGSHIELRMEQVLARTLGPKDVDVEIPHQLGTRMKDSLNVVETGERNILYNGLETSP